MLISYKGGILKPEFDLNIKEYKRIWNIFWKEIELRFLFSSWSTFLSLFRHDFFDHETRY